MKIVISLQWGSNPKMKIAISLQWGGNPSYSGGTYTLPTDAVIGAYSHFFDWWRIC